MSLLLIAATAAALTVQSNEIGVSPKFMDGNLIGCEIAFEIAFYDTAYHQGALTNASGSWAFHVYDDGGMWGVLKLGITPIRGRSEPTVGPSDAYIVRGYTTNKTEQKVNIDGDDGYRLFGFDATMDETLHSVMAPSFEDKFTVGYTLGEGRVPMTFEVALSGDDTVQYGDCVQALVATAREPD